MSSLTFDELEIKRALLATWSEKTQPAFFKEVPSYNQCAQTAIVIRDCFGGEILKTEVKLTYLDKTGQNESIIHFYNRIDGKRYDFTDDQFKLNHFLKPIQYQDIVVPKEIASATLQPSQLSAIATGFRANYKPVSL
jgi:hypothetical protein